MMRVNFKMMMVTITSSLVKGFRKWSLRVALPSSDEPWGRGVNNSDPWQAGNSMKMNFGCYFWLSGGWRVYKLRIIAGWEFFEDSTLCGAQCIVWLLPAGWKLNHSTRHLAPGASIQNLSDNNNSSVPWKENAPSILQQRST